MLWLILSIGSAALNSLRDLLVKHAASSEIRNYYPLAVGFRITGGVAVVCLTTLSWFIFRNGSARYLEFFVTHWQWIVFGTALEAIGQCLYFYALPRIQISTLSIIYSSSPLWIAVVNLVWYDDGALTSGGVFGILLMFASVTLPFITRDFRSSNRSLLGVLSIFTTSVLFAITSTTIKRLTVELGPEAVCLWYPVSAMFLAVASLFSAGARACFKRNGIFTVHVKLTPLFAVGTALTMLAYQLAPAAWVISAKRSGVLFTVLGGALFLGERSSMVRNLLAAVLSVAGIIAFAS